MIIISNLHKNFGSLNVLNGVNLEIPRNSIAVVIGPSGSGKSTFLRCLNALEKPERGFFQMGDFTIDFEKSCRKEIQALRGKFSMVFQHFNLFRNKTALQNVILPLILAEKMNRTDAVKRGMECLSKVGMSHKHDSYPATLSGGEKQRVGIARAMAVKPEIMLFDEPTSALDPVLAREVLQIIRELAAEKHTMLIVTHEMKFAKSVADMVFFFEGGVIVEKGKPEDIFSRPRQKRTMEFISGLL
jgi:putative amino-acid transport system ATP-binding protein